MQAKKFLVNRKNARMEMAFDCFVQGRNEISPTNCFLSNFVGYVLKWPSEHENKKNFSFTFAIY